MDFGSNLNAPACRTLPRQRRPGAPRLVSSLLVPALTGCEGVQSALDASGGDARRIELLSWILFGGGAAIFLVVTALILYAIFAAPERRRWLGTRRTVVAGGLVFPVVALTAVLTYGLVLLRITNAAGADPLRIEVVGEQYWWRVHYPADRDAPAFETANEIQVPLGRPVLVSVTSTDVIHSFWIPNFAGKIDMIPGRINQLRFEVERPGIYRGQCAEFCGDQHARMAFDVVALDPADFAAWRRAQARPAAAPATPFAQKGHELFTRGGCGNCHAVRGSAPRGGWPGPDPCGEPAQHRSAQFPNNVGTLAGWIADVQHLKGGVRMPSYGSLGGEDLRAVAAYVEGLR